MNSVTGGPSGNAVADRAYPNARHPGVPPQWNLSKVIATVAEANPDWTKERLVTAEIDYRHYLQLRSVAPEGEFHPAPDANEVWRIHTTDTEDYQAFCQEYFGYLLS